LLIFSGVLAMADLNQVESGSEALKWAYYVGVPVLGSLMTFFGIRVSGRMKKVEKNAQEAAESVKPNGTGHRTQTAMIEDVLLHLGELRGDVKALNSKTDANALEMKTHIAQDAENFKEIKNDIVQVKILFEETLLRPPQGD
jgi:hypothetical protein